MDYTIISKYEKQLTRELKNLQPEALRIYISIREKERKGYFSSKDPLLSLNNTIGSKYNSFVDSVRMQFANPNEFIAQWMHGLRLSYEKDNMEKTSDNVIIEMLKYKACEEYIKLFHTRNFYRNLIERTRFKPDERLWEIWFGNNTLFYGIMLSPAFRNGKWTNDVSEIRRTRYQYWTVEHILQAGIVSPEIPSPYRFAGLEDFLEFYGHVIIRLSHSDYERQIMKKYVEYLKNKKDYQSVPFLIPELRYLGINAKHQYRLDFTILNSHTRDMIGFEISPQSSHMQIDRIQGKTKDEMNVELRIKWEREMSKRNDYFKDLGISIITFTDKDLLNIDACFEKMKEFLEKRNKKPINLEEEISILKCL